MSENEQTPTPEATPAPEVTQAPEASVAPEASTAPEATEAPPSTPKWAQDRIDALTRKNYETARKAEALQKELDELKAGKVPDGKYTDKELHERALLLAAQLAAEQDYNKSCNAVYAKGKEQFSDFDTTLRNFANLGGLARDLVEAALETGKAHEVLYALGKDLDEAARVSQLPPVKKAVALVKLAESLEKKKEISKAPAPIKSVAANKTKNAASVNDDDISIDEWMKLRNADLEKRRSA